MAINVDDCYEIDENGLSITDNDGNAIYYLTAGTGDPSGSSAPQNTFYFRSDNQLIYYKFGAGDSDWRQIRAEDITALDADSLPSNIQTILDSLLTGDTPSVSQTMVFGDGGNKSANSYLTNQEVPSNVVGVPVGLANAKLRSFFLDNQNVRTGDVFVYSDGILIYTANISNQSKLIITGLDIPITQNSEISVQTGVSLKNVKVVLNINGDSA